jgi:hypothetical protein
MTTLLDTALAYHRAGLTVLPNDPARKFPAGLSGWQQVAPTEQDIRKWFANGHHAIGVRDVEGLDFDNKGNPDAAALYREWAALVNVLRPGLVDKLLCERTPSGGFHLVWRCEEIAGNQKLATRPPTPAELTNSPKLTAVALIETRGRGGQFQVAPSPGYEVQRGSWTQLPQISPADRAILLDCARALTRTDKRTIDLLGKSTGERAGDRYNADPKAGAEALKLLTDVGWAVAMDRDGIKYLIRPGKDKGVSATFGFVAPDVLYVFSSNASPFDAGRAYSPFAIYTELAHDGDYKRAARALWERYEGTTTASAGTLVPASEGAHAQPVQPTQPPSAPIDVNDLLVMERKPTVWYAPGFLREGLGLLVGQPNVGKTPLAAQLAIAVARGDKWMGAVQTQQARVLYLGMEYSAQELIPLFDISRCGQDIPRGQLLIKTIEDDFPTTAEEALSGLEWYMRVLGVRLIIIDVLTAFLPPEKFKQNVYRGDYSELKPYHRLALQYNAAILGVWHASKRESDPKLMYNGSTGMWAAAASRVTMYQDQEQRVRIASFARMADRVDWALAQEKRLDGGRRWIVADANPEPICSPTELSIYRCLKEHADKSRPFSAQTVADMTGVEVRTVRTLLPRMFEKNLIQKARSGDGYYIETVVAPVAGVAPVADVAGVALVASQHVATDVAPTLLTDTALGSGETGEQQEQRDSDSNKQRQNALDTQKADMNRTEPNRANGIEIGYKELNRSDPLEDDKHPVWADIPRWKAPGLRLYMRSNIESDQARARQICEELGVDYDDLVARIEKARRS